MHKDYHYEVKINTSFVSEPVAIYPSATDKPTKFCNEMIHY